MLCAGGRAVVEQEQIEYVPIDGSVITAQQADTYTQPGLIPDELDVRAEFDTRHHDLVGGDR